MFEKVKEDRVIRKLNEIGRNLSDEDIKLPSEKDIIDAKKELEENFFKDDEGRINFSYARNVLIGLNHSETHFHYSTGLLLLDDITNNKRIYIRSYYKNRED